MERASKKLQPNREAVASHLAELIRCKTVSYDPGQTEEDREGFGRFPHLLGELYPEVTRVCSREFIGKTGLLYRWKGRNCDQVTVLMSHYDVVPADETLWTKPPFSGMITEDAVWGRGALDTKATLCAIMEAAELLIKEGFIPEQDLYFSFSGEEEISGATTPDLVRELANQGIRPALVLDEGGAVVENIFPGLRRQSALIGTGEKGYLDVVLEVKGQGGHSSAPPPHSPVGRLAKAVTRIENHPFRARLTPPVREMLKTLGSRSILPMRFVTGNLWLFFPLLENLFRRKGGEMNAMLRTTCVATRMEGSPAFNVIPPQASVGFNLRLLPGDSIKSALDYLTNWVRDPHIALNVVEGSEASPVSPTTGESWKRLKEAIGAVWPEAVVSPYLMLGATDSRHYCTISEQVYRFSAMRLSDYELGLIHGNDERITIGSLMETVEFYLELMRKS